MKTEKKRRKSYSLDPERTRELARHALNMSDATQKTVHRQEILDTLVGLLADKTVYAKVVGIIAKK